MLSDALKLAYHFSRARWALRFNNRKKLEFWQKHQLKRFIRDVLPQAPFYRDLEHVTLSEMPIMDKALMMTHFNEINTCSVTLEQAMSMALAAEESRDFTGMVGKNLTVGLSSGTSGNRGVFVLSKEERIRWAAIILARSMPSHLLYRIFTPWVQPIRIAFFLRANSNLYTTLNSRRIDFAFHDLLLGIEPAISPLNRMQPDVLVGPPSLLHALAIEAKSGRLTIHPSHVISVADVLEAADSHAVYEAFGMRPHQIYQATEGFLAYTCEQGALHLNETFMHIEPDWVDDEHTHFQPIVTDFSRHTQLIVRYRLNDILRVAEHACACGRGERTISAIEGRSDEVIWLPSISGGHLIAIYPDQIRRVMLLVGAVVVEYSVIQSGLRLKIGLLVEEDWAATLQQVTKKLTDLWRQMKTQPPELSFTAWQPPEPGAKRRRIHRELPPEGMKCAF
ncbi:MAG: hypothetical protein PF483_07905 [Halothiobacillus sp.]|nr:hypothetical protein [Halothiobacillus sp.]